jgi:transcriptional regulator with XRE-family HTH domain
MLGKNQRTVSTWETGRQEPSLSEIVKLGDIFGCSMDVLLGREEPQGPFRPSWLTELDVYLADLDKAGQAAVKALVKGLSNKIK